MPDQFMTKQDDSELTYLFKNFETLISGDKTVKNWFVLTEFQVFSEYLIKDIKQMQNRLKNPNDEYLYYVCRHVFDIQDWIKLMVEDAGFLTFGIAWETLFDKQFGNKHILKNIYDDCFDKWVSGKTGQYQIGENLYNILEGRLYYRNRFGKWFQVDRKTAFDLSPNQEVVEDDDSIQQLNNEYKDTWYDKIIKKWESKQFQSALPDNFLEFNDTVTNPDYYFDYTTDQIKILLENPVSIAELERWNGGEIADLEHIVKIVAFVMDMTKKRRMDDSHTIYLLRDCLMFHEAHKILDILNSEETSSDQLLVGRKLLSNKPGVWGYYATMLDALYNAHLRFPTDFTEFYNEFARLMDMFAALNPKFAALIAELADYIKQYIRTDKNKIVIFDIGFQGSIAILTKYIIDRHIIPTGTNGKIETDIEIGIGALWSKSLFGQRHVSDYFPLLNRVQLMTRSNELYHYKEDSLQTGKLQVVMGDKKAQRKAAVELAVLTMVAVVTQTDKS
ncbi:MAG: hypothetical protein NTV39_04360 [Candidatus Saccharibacteria bacterium]|nr:hypothetical protein [Candidatus Saccharibacteria bacterium]